MDNLNFVGAMNPKRLTSLEEDFKAERAQILEDRKRFAKYGTNSAKKIALIESGVVEEMTYERFKEEG